MIPFLHLGPLTIPTFGLMVATGLLVSAYVLQADFDRRRERFLKRGYLKENQESSHHDEGFPSGMRGRMRVRSSTASRRISQRAASR